MTLGRRVDEVLAPQARVRKVGVSPRVTQVNIQLVGQLVQARGIVGGGAANIVHLFARRLVRQAVNHVGAALANLANTMLDIRHNAVQRVARAQNVVTTTVHDYQVGLECQRLRNLLLDDVADQLAANRQISIQNRRQALLNSTSGKVTGKPVSPAEKRSFIMRTLVFESGHVQARVDRVPQTFVHRVAHRDHALPLFQVGQHHTSRKVAHSK